MSAFEGGSVWIPAPVPFLVRADSAGPSFPATTRPLRRSFERDCDERPRLSTLRPHVRVTSLSATEICRRLPACRKFTRRSYERV